MSLNVFDTTKDIIKHAETSPYNVPRRMRLTYPLFGFCCSIAARAGRGGRQQSPQLRRDSSFNAPGTLRSAQLPRQ